VDDPKKAVGKKVRELRTAMGISQEDLAETADLHRTYVGALERGETNISLVNLVRIARALKVKPSVLIEEIR
jgi:transcriptional regulator with XRE-family HTH domain